MLSDRSGGVEEYGIPYWICLVSGGILIGAFFYIPQMMSNGEPYGNLVYVLTFVCPTLSGALLSVLSDHGIFLAAVSVLHILSVFWIAIHVVTKKPVPSNVLVILTRTWTFTSIGLIVLVIAVFLYSMLKDNSRNRGWRR